MGLTRREFIKFGAVAAAGALAAEAVDKVSQGNTQLDFRTNQVRHYFEWLLQNSLGEQFEIKEDSLYWEPTKALVATNGEGRVELVIPYRPQITTMGFVGVSAGNAGRHISLSHLTAEVPNMADGKQIPGIVLFSSPLQEAERLSQLPIMRQGVYFDNLVFQARQSAPFFNAQALLGLKFEVALSQELTDLHDRLLNITYVEDVPIFSDLKSRMLGPWSEQAVFWRREDSELTDTYSLPRISIAKHPTSNFRYFLI